MSLLEWLGLISFILLFTAAIVVAPAVRARLTGRPGEQAWHDAALEIWKVLGPLTAVFLIFLLVQAMGYFREAEVAVSREAGNLVQLDRALVNAGSPLGADARARLQDYTRSVIQREWPAMRRGDDVLTVGAPLQALQDAVVALMAASPERAARYEVLKNLNDVEDDRTTRAGAAGGQLPTVLWWVAAGLFALMLGTTAMFREAQPLSRMAGLHAAALALLVTLLFAVDGPYRGGVTVSARPLTQALAAMAARN